MSQQVNIGVIFDVDGVLVDSARLHFESWRLLGREHGFTITPRQFAETFGRHNGDIIPRLFGEVTPEELDRLARRKEKIYRQLVGLDPPIVAGASELLRNLARNGYRLAVGSSGPLDNIRLILAALGAEGLIQTIVSGDDVTRGKPDPQVFALACQRLNLPPARCVVIEDAPVGIEASRQAGAKSIGVSLYHPRRTLRAASLTVGKLADITVEMIYGMVAARSSPKQRPRW